MASALVISGLCACGGPSPVLPSPLVPEDFATALTEVRPCQASADHELRFVRILADPATAARFDNGPFPLPIGSLVVKEESDDATCARRSGFSAVRKEASMAHGMAWRWQKLDAARLVLEDGALKKCSSCHASCVAPDRDGLCAQ